MDRMNLIVRPLTRGQFTLEVDWFDTVIQVKDRIELILGIPISRLSLYHDGRHLRDHLNLVHTPIFEGTTIDLVITPPTPPIDLMIRPANGNNLFMITLQQYWDFTIRQIKEKIQQDKVIPINSQTLLHEHRILQDHLTLQSTTIDDFDVLDLVIAGEPGPIPPPHLPPGPFPPPPMQQWDVPPPNSHQAVQLGRFPQPSQYQSGPRQNLEQGFYQLQPQHQPDLPTSSHGSGNHQRLMVRVLVENQVMPLEVEVNPWDRVETLRRVLWEAFGRSLRFPPLGELCFYHHGRDGMFEEETFAWHDVHQGDVIFFSPGNRS